MALSFDAALAAVTRELDARGDVVGLLFFGSAARGTAVAGSDVDLYAVTRAEARGHLGRVVGGVPVEVSFGSVAQWRGRLGRELPAVVHAFATGRAIRDETGGALDALRAEAAALWARGPRAPAPAPRRRRTEYRPRRATEPPSAGNQPGRCTVSRAA